MSKYVPAIVLGLAGFSILVAEAGWLIGVGVFLMIWGNNYQLSLEP